MTDAILGEAPQVPDEVWIRARTRALDPNTSFDPTLLPGPAEPSPPSASEPTESEDSAEPPRETFDDPLTDHAGDSASEPLGSFGDDTDSFGLD